MSGRDAIDRLNRLRRSGKPMGERLTAFRPDDLNDLPPPFDLTPLTIAPDGQLQHVCGNFPECECEGDCTVGSPASPVADWIVISLLAATVAIGAALIAWSFWP